MVATGCDFVTYISILYWFCPLTWLLRMAKPSLPWGSYLLFWYLNTWTAEKNGTDDDGWLDDDDGALVVAVDVCGCFGALYFNDSFVADGALSFVDWNKDASLLF